MHTTHPMGSFEITHLSYRSLRLFKRSRVDSLMHASGRPLLVSLPESQSGPWCYAKHMGHINRIRTGWHMRSILTSVYYAWSSFRSSQYTRVKSQSLTLKERPTASCSTRSSRAYDTMHVALTASPRWRSTCWFVQRLGARGAVYYAIRSNRIRRSTGRLHILPE